MLDTDTKRRIDTARDILVGKVPDPKSQVEQITIALIYKFMDDMDAEAEELGGKRKFFAGKFARFGWAKLMRSGLGGHETLALYGEGIASMTENPGLPPLFRDIFKNAYLPYRDPETLKAFLKVIDEFAYDHSERLGDAFEYLLSVLGSQGDAGQFRTPRHIIDFIVALLDPRKHETVLDPACGTAGFIISAYKHIQRANTDARGHGTLTPDERARLAKNLKGYDISPDMVRLSLVNLYLHGFTAPQVFEYDTLTSEERWNEHADVILANPPFMTPKGGIKPHKRFSIQAKRSEVLFVDYMAEHLTPNGRAGIVVPEGIIFKNQKAYVALRKVLVDTSLVAVVSLPAGCFNPYSGVKTSILVLDKSIAPRAQAIAFFKVENDGFDLGAQRQPIDENDLPKVQAELHAYLQALRSNTPVHAIPLTTGLVVPKEKIAAKGDWNLSGERYREGEDRQHRFPLVRIGDVCVVNPSKGKVTTLGPEARVSFVPMADIHEHRITFQPTDEKALSEVGSSYTYFEDGDVLLAKVTPCFENGKAGIARGLVNGIGFGSSEFYVLRPSPQVLPEWIYFCVMHPLFREAAIAQMTGTGGLQRVPRSLVENFQIPLPPLEVQREIVAEIEGYQKVIQGARAVLENYRPHIPIQPDWPMEVFGNVTSTITPPAKINAGDFRKTGRYPVIDQSQDAIAGRTDDEGTLVDGTDGLVIFGDHTCAVKFVQEPFAQGADGIKIIRPAKEIEPKFAYYYLLSYPIRQDGYKRHFAKLKESSIAVPPLSTQRAIVAEIEAEQALVGANRELITRFEKKIQATLARIWGDGATSP